MNEVEPWKKKRSNNDAENQIQRDNMEVSKNRHTPKSSNFTGCLNIDDPAINIGIPHDFLETNDLGGDLATVPMGGTGR